MEIATILTPPSTGLSSILLSSDITFVYYLENIVDPDQKPADQDPHWFPICL